MKHLHDFSMNKNAVHLLKEKVIPNAEKLRIGVSKLENGATLIDMGINYSGGWMAGKYFTEVGLGGLGELNFGKMMLKKHIVPSVRIKTTQPAICEMASHAAHWFLPYKDRFVSIGGPIRSITGTDSSAQAVDYRDYSTDVAVACIQTDKLPDEGLTDIIAKEVNIKTENLFVLASRTGTIVGAIQVCARNVEQTLPALHERKFPLDAIIQANGVTPVVSVVDDEEIALGRVNDCLIYGQETNVYVRCCDDKIINMLEGLPFVKNKDVYGIEFQKLFAKCEHDWSKVPRDWDAPCKVNFINLSSGNVFSTGRISYNALERSFLGE
jgi:methenyltetrahydromethanopterin cyclohydrolase